jgi:hypothetical protein
MKKYIFRQEVIEYQYVMANSEREAWTALSQGNSKRMDSMYESEEIESVDDVPYDEIDEEDES